MFVSPNYYFWSKLIWQGLILLSLTKVCQLYDAKRILVLRKTESKKRGFAAMRNYGSVDFYQIYLICDLTINPSIIRLYFLKFLLKHIFIIAPF